MQPARQPTAAEPAESQVDILYRLIRDEIVSCRIGPGERFTERELMARAGAGRTPLREALLRLQQEGLVVALPRSGYEATQVTEKTVNDLFDVWRPIGPLIARLAFSRMTPEIREQIRVLDNADISSVHKQLDRSQRLFELLVAAAQNEDLTYIWRRLSAQMRRVFLVFLSSDIGGEWLLQVGSMTDLAQSSNPDAVAAGIADAIARSHAGALEVLRRRASAAGAAPAVAESPSARARPRARGRAPG